MIFSFDTELCIPGRVDCRRDEDGEFQLLVFVPESDEVPTLMAGSLPKKERKAILQLAEEKWAQQEAEARAEARAK